MFTTTSSGAEAWIRHLAGRFGRIVSLGYYLEDSGDGLEDPVRVGEWLRWVLEFRPTPEAQSAAAGGGGSDQCAGGAGNQAIHRLAGGADSARNLSRVKWPQH
jgi:hypothetical protein